MSRGKGTDRNAVKEAGAWICMKRYPDSRAAWEAHLTPPRFEQADMPIRAQTETAPPVERPTTGSVRV